jgi:hypothetical membrane protein
VGPGAFVGAWLACGATEPGYSPVDDAISRLAAVGASTRPLMTAGLVVYGTGVAVYAVPLRSSVPGSAWKAALATGLAALGVAAFPLDASSTIDVVHGGVASVGYLTLAATPLLAARALAASGHRRAAAISVVVGVVSGLCLAATVIGPGHGLVQRIGLTLSDGWLVASALWMLCGGRAGPREPGGPAGAAVRRR